MHRKVQCNKHPYNMDIFEMRSACWPILTFLQQLLVSSFRRPVIGYMYYCVGQHHQTVVDDTMRAYTKIIHIPTLQSSLDMLVRRPDDS